MTDASATAKFPPVILWFRNDRRLADQPALQAALSARRPIVAIFVLDDAAAGAWAPGAAWRWWLHHSLAALRDDIAARGGELVLRRGTAAEIIPALARETGATDVFTGRPAEPWARRQDQAVARTLRAMGAGFHRVPTALLHDPDTLRTRDGGVFGVYTPFARAVRALPIVPRTSPPPEVIPAFRGRAVASDALDAWRLLPRHPDWAGGLRATWQPGEAGALARLARFIDGDVASYARKRDVPGGAHTSMLSPHLAHGEIAPGRIWQAVMATVPDHDGAQKFLNELLWREFSYYQLWHHPELPERPLRQEFAAMPWRDEPDDLRAWQHGRTGIPMVDAGMRELWRLGWMHNRVRMVAASFLVKHLLVPWQLGAAWFWDTLVDADLASNSASWQWVAGSGADAAPYFRIFNPVLQGARFDPAGTYVRRFVPELRHLPDADVHAPWQIAAPPADYPAPIIDLPIGRSRALAAFAALKQGAASGLDVAAP